MVAKKKAKRAARHNRKLKPHEIVDQKLNVALDRMGAMVDLMKSNSDALIDGVRAHLRTIEHTLSLDEASRSDMRSLREAMTDMRRELEYRKSMGR